MEFSRNKIAGGRRVIYVTLATPFSLQSAYFEAAGCSRHELKAPFAIRSRLCLCYDTLGFVQTSLRSNIEPFYLLSADRGAGNFIRPREASPSNLHVPSYERFEFFPQFFFPPPFYTRKKNVPNVNPDEE